ncbi:MAG: hypothetical protein IT461_03415 [Planctomycetes bacterium]|nr:hypothetical protein [Planctomycetota bacterium]
MNVLRKHGRFIVALIVLVVLAAWGHSAVGEMSETIDKKQQSLNAAMKGHYARVFADAKASAGKPANVQSLIIGEKTLKTQELEEKRNALMQFRPDPRFTLAPVEAKGGNDADKKDYFTNTMFSQVRAELERARYFRPKFEDPAPLGFSVEASAIKPENVAELLLKLDIAREVCNCAERAGVQSLDKLNFDDGYGAKLGQRGLPTLPGPMLADKTRQPAYLEVRALTVNLRGNERAVYNLLIELQRPVKGELRDRYLAVEAFSFSKPDLYEPADDLVSVTLTVVAYKVNSDGFVPGGKKKEAETTTTTSGGGRFR